MLDIPPKLKTLPVGMHRINSHKVCRKCRRDHIIISLLRDAREREIEREGLEKDHPVYQTRYKMQIFKSINIAVAARTSAGPAG